MNSFTINNPEKEDKRYKITSLNTCSLRKDIHDIKCDFQLLSSNVICLQETWLEGHEESDNVYQINNFRVHFNSYGRGKGIVTYFPETYSVEGSVSDSKFQITKIVTSSMQCTYNSL